jgi:hypothetical protein
MGSKFNPKRLPFGNEGDAAQPQSPWRQDDVPSLDEGDQGGSFHDEAPPAQNPALGGVLGRLQPPPAPVASADRATPNDADLTKVVAQLRTENAQLKQFVDQARNRLSQMDRAAEHWQGREQEYENLLEEKSEQIRQLQAQVGELERNGGGGARPDGGGAGVLSEEELLQIQNQLDEERRQMEQERRDMEEEFKRAELAMAKERADMARQKGELQRARRELEVMIETAQRVAVNAEQQNRINQLRSDLLKRPGGGGGPITSGPRVPTPPAGVPQQGYHPPGAPQGGPGMPPPPGQPQAPGYQINVDPTKLQPLPPEQQNPNSPNKGSIWRKLRGG